MPGKEHLPSVSDKEQRMYEHIKRSEREQKFSRPTDVDSLRRNRTSK